MNSDNPLRKLMQEWNTPPAPVGIAALAEAARNRHDGVAAVLFYGSCLRSGRADEGIADLYLLVDDYQRAFGSRFQACMNRLLPPNVFYLEIPCDGKILRAKYAVLTLEDFRPGDTPLVPFLYLGPLRPADRPDLCPRSRDRGASS